MDRSTALKIADQRPFRIKVVGAMYLRAAYSLGTEQSTAPGFLLAQQLLQGTYDLDMWATSVVQDAAFLALSYETVGEDGEGASMTTIDAIINSVYELFKL